MKYLLFNPNYTIKPDKGKALLMLRYLGRNLIEDIDDSTVNLIHPIYAMILSFMNGKEYEVCVRNASNFLNISYNLVAEFINDLVDNKNCVFVKSKENGNSMFFPNTIISLDEEMLQERFNPTDFYYSELNLKLDRHLTPTRVTLMFNNICYTDCIYCYEDKSIKVNCNIPYNRIIELIHEAKDLHVVSFDVVGGEFFLYNKWKEILKELCECGFSPYISTKMPLSRADVQVLADLKIRDIQVSLDTMIEKHLKDSIRIKDGYVSKMISSLKLLEEYHIPVMLHSVLTQYNDSIEDMKSLYKVCKEYSNISDWHIVKGDKTLYPRTDYKNIEIESDKMLKICTYLKDIAGESPFPIKYPSIPQENQTSLKEPIVMTNEMTNEINKQNFFSRSFCSGLFSSLFILPNGKVTMCEQLYWNHPRFIVGDVMNNSLEDIWNSNESKSLYYIKSTDIPKDSNCHSCKDFQKCREGRQVCYRDIVMEYGKDKWYYPDTKCPYITKN